MLGRSHRTVPESALRTALHHFVTLPADRTVNIAENRAPIAVITEAEVVLAIRALIWHKAPGSEGLGNDFYKDLQSLLVSPLVEIASEIIPRVQPHKSVMEAVT